MILAIQNLHVALMIPPRFCLLQHMVQEDMSFEKKINVVSMMAILDIRIQRF